MKITKEIGFDYGHRVPDHKSKCRHLHGHRARLLVTVSGPILDKPGDNDNGMVMDFSDIKRLMIEEIHDLFDHKLILYKDDPIVESIGDVLTKHDIESGLILFPMVPTAENLAKYCFEILNRVFIKFFHRLEIYLDSVVLYETPNSFAECTRQEYLEYNPQTY